METKNQLLLIETMRWEFTQGETGFYLLDLHMERLFDSALYFGFSFERGKIWQELEPLEKKLRKYGRKTMRVRLTLNPFGKLKADYAPLDLTVKKTPRVDISPIRVQSNDQYLFHKTTRREIFDIERERLDALGLFETIFLNERDELTQGTITNLFLDMGKGPLLTPALSCGLLPGTLRRHLLESGKAQEAILFTGDLFRARRIFVGNSVRGLLEATLA